MDRSKLVDLAEVEKVHSILKQLRKGRFRNKECPCGSGKKIKFCCLKKARSLAEIEKVRREVMQKLLKGNQDEQRDNEIKKGNGDSPPKRSEAPKD